MRLDPGFPHTPGETPESFVSRLARINGLPSGKELCRDLGIGYGCLMRGAIEPVTRLCELTGSHVDTLLHETRRHVGKRYVVRGQAMAVTSFLGASVRICPECLAEDAGASKFPASVAAYGRTSWTVTHIRTCHRHGTVLVDLPAMPKLTVQDFASVVAPWLGRDPDEVGQRRRSPSRFETYLLDRLDGHRPGNWLDAFPFYAAARVCEMLGAAMVFGPRPGRIGLTADDWARAGEAGYEVVSEGPTAVSDVFRGLLDGFAGNRATPVGPAGWFGDTYVWLNHRSLDPAYGPFRDLLVRCVADHAPFNPNERVFGKPLPYRKVHSIRSASRETGIGVRRLRKALDRAGYLPPGHEVLPWHVVTFDATAAAPLLRRLAEAMPMSLVAEELGVSAPQVRQLADAGYIAELDPRTTCRSLPSFARDEFEDFLLRLRANAETVAVPPAGTCDLHAATRQAQCRLTETVDMVLGDRLGWVGSLEGTRGFRSILVDAAEVRSLARRADLKGLLRRQVQHSLGIPTRTVNLLIEKGLLAATLQRHPSVPRHVHLVAADDVESFRARYARLTDAAAMLGMSLPSTRCLLDAQGILPALSKEEFGAAFYGRAEIGAVVRERAAHRGEVPD